MGEIADAIDDSRRIAHAIRHFGREVEMEVAAGTPLPADMYQELLVRRWFLDSNILDEQSQHSLAVFGRCGASVP